MIRVFPGRRFEVAEFTGARGILRVSSPRTEREPYVDLMFRGVAYVDLPAELPPDLAVLETQAHDLAFARSRLARDVAAEDVFVIEAGGRRYRVVAAELKVAESERPVTEDPFPRT